MSRAARVLHVSVFAMRFDEEDDHKKPMPVRQRRKGEGTREAAEHGPYAVGPHGPKDDHRDHHRHVIRC